MNTITESLIYVSGDQKSVTYNDILITDIELILQKVLPSIKELDINNLDAQKLFLNYFIVEICEYIKTIDSIKYTFFINRDIPLINNQESSAYLSLIHKVLDLMSISYIEKLKTLDQFIEGLNVCNDDDLISLEIIKTTVRKRKNSKRILNFLTRNGLTFLHTTYFKNPSNKLILFR